MSEYVVVSISYYVVIIMTMYGIYTVIICYI